MRKLSVREKTLLCILLVLVLVSGYVALFYMPMTQQLDNLEQQIGFNEQLIFESQLRVEKKRQMEAELEEIFANNSDPRSLAPYDNVQAVMMELNGILEQAQEYSLNFGTVDTQERIIRRSISMHFTTADEASAKSILQQLHDSSYRCMLDDVSITLEQRDSYGAEVTATIVFFEYQE